jgi:predicted metalloprotease with PDZ domain
MDPVLTRPVSRFRLDVLRSAKRTSRLVAAGLSLAVLLGGASLASAQALEPIAYTIRVPAPESHIAEIEASFPTGRQPSIELMMPVWSPGFYRIENYADKIQDLSARTSDGTALQVEKTRANRWRVTTNGAPRVSVSYRLSCTGRSVTTNTVGTDLGVFNGAATFITLVEHTKRPHDVRLELAPTWKQSMSGLAPAPDGAPDHYHAADFDTLVDSPILAGNLAIDRFDVGGRAHYVVAGGDTSQWNGAKAAGDLKKIAEAAQQFWGALPYTRYVFLIALRQGGGGLEHMNSAFVNSSPGVMGTPRSYTSWLPFMSHEYFHAFNVKRLRPIELGPFDYETSPHTTSLWISEGVTSYYGNLLVLRAGLSTIDDVLASMSSQIDQLQKAPGRLAQTLEQSSADVWTNSTSGVNASSGTVSYYVKGQVVGFLLDAHIRCLTDNRKSFDDVMRAAFERYSGDKGFTSEQFQAVASRVAAVDLKDWFRKAIASSEELEYAEALDWYGLRFAKAEDGSATWRLERREDATAAQKQHLATVGDSR